MPAAVLTPERSLAYQEWTDAEHRHQSRADELTADHRARASRGRTHPVEDFLFTYYSYKPAIMRRWHPGAGVALERAGESTRASWRWYSAAESAGSLRIDVESLRRERGAMIANIARVLRATAGRAAGFGCFGLHEWAMVYRDPDLRHDVPLRLGQRGTDEVVEAHELRCTHFDAYRFFTPPAEPRNRVVLTRESQPAMEQPGCLHAGMDLYKWAIKLGPLVPGDVLLDTFALAREIRTLDMQASPYDLRDWGYAPVQIETSEGKAEYVRRQREFTARSQELRRQLLAALAPVLLSSDR